MPRRPHDPDVRWMKRAIAQARHGEGLTRPNPPVGAVIVRQGRSVSTGYHRKAGEPHAEINALRAAGTKARRATLYITLEPCSTWGRTPPCTDAIVASGIKRVVIGCLDPNPRHAGRGVHILRRAGILVSVRVLEEECRALIEPFAKWITTGRPYVTLKMGVTLDGRIADAHGRSRWITGPAARHEVQKLRRRVDAILIGRQTAQADDPSLLPVPEHGRKPLRVVLDAAGRLSLRSRLYSDGRPAQTLVMSTRQAPNRYRRALAARGIECVVMPARQGRFQPDQILRELGRRGILHVACEGGGHLAASFLRAGMVDDVWWFIAPMLLGDRARPSIAGINRTLMRAPRFRLTDVQRIGQDIWLRAKPER